MAARAKTGSGATSAPDPLPPRVYVAHPMSCYKTTHARRLIARLGRFLPNAAIVDPEQMGWTASEEWFDAWPDILAGLAGFVVFAAPDETIGLGCVRELTDALAVGIPLAGLDSSGLLRIDGFRLLPESKRTYHAIARLLLGARLDPAKYQQTLGDGGNIRP